MSAARKVLAAALFALSVLYAIWFHGDKHYLASMLVFTLPPLALLPFVLRGSAKAGFWAGVLALFWFSHGVMTAWSHRAEVGYAWAELLLALVIVFSSSWNGLSKRFGRKSAKE